MTAHSKIVWSEGLFLRPQHLQQQDRYLERYIENRCHALRSHTGA
jgi:type VI secretion system protein ImpJ